MISSIPLVDRLVDNYLKCLINANEEARESSVADFEFSDAREAVIFSQWMGAILPIDDKQYVRLPSELGWYEPAKVNPIEALLRIRSDSAIYRT